MKKIFALMVGIILCLGGCVSYEEYYKLDKDYISRRQLETRFFKTNDEKKILVTATQLLQDHEFELDETETKLGLITAYKNKEAGSIAETTASVAIALVAKAKAIYDTEQKIYITLVTTKNSAKNGYNVRVEFARVIWNNINLTRVETIQDEAIYQEFFDKLGKALSLTPTRV